MPSCNQLQPRRKIALPICGWQRRSRRFSAAYAPRPRHLISWNVKGSSDYWSRRYWSLTMRSLSGIRSPLRPTPLITTSRRNPPSLGHQNTQVIFCVQGVITPPCGVPAVRDTMLPSSICTGAFSQRSTWSSTQRQSKCLRSALSINSQSILSK
jgi:hypothetical protein